jgi:hypothetical protein
LHGDTIVTECAAICAYLAVGYGSFDAVIDRLEQAVLASPVSPAKRPPAQIRKIFAPLFSESGSNLNTHLATLTSVRTEFAI